MTKLKLPPKKSGSMASMTPPGGPAKLPTAPLTHAIHALESSRNAGFDLSAAVGELIDNSWEAGASCIRLETKRDASGSIVEIAVADGGNGIPVSVLASVLSLGFSTRYDSRTGLGRFGMGLKLASLSQARRTEVYTRVRGSRDTYRSYLDIDEVRDEKQTELRVEKVAGWPADFAHLMSNYRTKKPFESGTLVVWRKIDRLQQGGSYGTAVQERLQDLTKFLARAYRRFIDKGLMIELDGVEISLHDPLFLLDNPRVTKRFKDSLKARIIQQDSFHIDGHRVDWTVTLLPEQFRERRGEGGRATKGREEFADLYIPDNESKISILRNGREIFYELVPKLYPGGRDRIDRYIGVEVQFPAQLDEYFQVRNVKRGAEPVSKLREQLRLALKAPIQLARKEVRDHWIEVIKREQSEKGDADKEAHGAVEEFDRTAPSGRANLGAGDEQLAKIIGQIIEDMGLEPEDPDAVRLAEWVRESFNARSTTILTGGWPGKELLDISHLNGKAIVRVNRRHPFFEEVISPLEDLADTEASDVDTDEVPKLARRLRTSIDLLLMSYAKAENMHLDPDTAFSTLRSHWGTFCAGMIGEQKRRWS